MVDDAATVEQLRAELRRCLERAELAEAEDAFWRQKEAATGEILRAIATSPVEFKRVLDTLGRAAATLGEAERVSVQLRHGDALIAVDSSTGALMGGGTRIPITRGTFSGRALLDRRLLHVPDCEAMGAEFAEGKAIVRALAPKDAWRSGVFAPLFRGDEAVGVLLIARSVPRPFTERQIALFATFADQAVVAIENARLFGELAELNRTLETRVDEQVEQLERVGRLRRYLSPQLADLILSSGDESILASHRRQITVVFCDLRGFTAFAETAEPEEVMSVLGEYHAAIGPLIHEHGGTLDKFAGDGLMVIFNDPLPQPDHAERAVRMACAMRDRAAELARGWRRQGHDLGLGIGIAVGYATLGRIGFEGRSDYTAIGTVTNLAARLCAEAADGQVVVHGRVHSMVEELVEAESLGELVLKGLHRPVAAFNVLGLRET
jgi:class 3 adenylate cyclase